MLYKSAAPRFCFYSIPFLSIHRASFFHLGCTVNLRVGRAGFSTRLRSVLLMSRTTAGAGHGRKDSRQDTPKSCRLPDQKAMQPPRTATAGTPVPVEALQGLAPQCGIIGICASTLSGCVGVTRDKFLFLSEPILYNTHAEGSLSPNSTSRASVRPWENLVSPWIMPTQCTATRRLNRPWYPFDRAQY